MEEVWIISVAVVIAASIIGNSIYQAAKHIGDRINNHANILDEVRQKLGSIQATIAEN